MKFKKKRPTTSAKSLGILAQSHGVSVVDFKKENKNLKKVLEFKKQSWNLRKKKPGI